MVLVTGASGFIGNHLCTFLGSYGCDVRAVSRGGVSSHFLENINQRSIDNIDNNTQWKSVLKDVDCIVHLAGRVHIINEYAEDSLSEFRKANVEETLRLAEHAATAGVRRFIYLSSIKVNGEEARKDRPFSADDIPEPIGPYAVSKYEAEQALLKLGMATGMEIVIIRPPLVYGPGVKANFKTMMKWLSKRIPLPLGAISNLRSFVGINNLMNFVFVCMSHPAAAGQVFLVADDEDISTPVLLKRLSGALGVSSRLFSIPLPLLKFIFTLLGKQKIYQRLTGSLCIDITKNKDLLGWWPSHDVSSMLKDTADEFLKK